MPDLVKLRLKFKPAADAPSTEALWAEPVDVADGSYRLQNSSFMVPLAAGDVVRAEPAGDGELQVTGLVAPSASILTIVGAPPGAGLDLQPTVEAWSSQGALWTEGNAGMLVTTWSPELRLDMIETVIRPSLGTGLQWLATALPSMRDAEHMPEVDFELQRVVIEPVEE